MGEGGSVPKGALPNVAWVVIGAVLFFLYQQFQSVPDDQKLSIDDHIEGATQFQHFIENGDHSEGDFVLQDKLSNWREWMVKNSEPMPDIFKDDVSSGSSGSIWSQDSLQISTSNLSPIEEAQKKLAMLEQKQEEQRNQLQYSDRFDEETKAQLLADGGKSLELNFEEPEGETKPLTVAEMLGQKTDTPLIEPIKAKEPKIEVEQNVETTSKPKETIETTKVESEVVEDKTEDGDDMHYEVNDDDFFKDDEEQEDVSTNEDIEQDDNVPDSFVEVDEDVVEEIVQDATNKTEEESVEKTHGENSGAEDEPKDARFKVPTSATGEKRKQSEFLDPEEKKPKFVIIGSTKCSTSALLRFLQFHPKLRSAKSELYFFNKHYENGLEWYLEQFEQVAVRGLTLFEKTPTYYQNPNVPKRIFDAFPDMKLIISVCHPVKRLISRYYHALAIRPDTINDLGDFDHYQNKLKHYKKNATNEFQSVYDDENIKEKIQAITENFLLKHKMPFNHMVLPQAILLNSCYSIFLRNWLKYFPKQQIHIVDGNEIITNPAKVMMDVENFVEVEKWYSEENFVINPETGFYCIKQQQKDAELHCLTGGGKGRTKESMNPQTVAELKDFYRPFNEDLTNLFPEFKHKWEEDI